MITAILKRDGRQEPFDSNKITTAITAAVRAVGCQNSVPVDMYVSKVVTAISVWYKETVPSVEQVQDLVENVLIEHGEAKVAKAYILYRAERNRQRDMNAELMHTFKDITFMDSSESDTKRENANIDGNSAMGAMLKYGTEGAKHFNHLYLLDPDVSEAHKNGDIHIHDLDFYALTMTCCQIDLSKLFSGGFSTGHGHLREPNDIASYSSLTCIAIQANQNDQHGGQSIPALDYYLAPGVLKTFRKRVIDNLTKYLEIKLTISADTAVEVVKKTLDAYGVIRSVEFTTSELERLRGILTTVLADKGMPVKFNAVSALAFALKKALGETDKATYQAMEALIHNLNTMHSRAGAQTPFSSINYGTDTSPEGRMVIKNVLLATKSGLGNYETPILPNQGFKIKEGVNYNPSDPNYDLFRLMLQVTAKRLNPTFIFLDAPFNLQYYKQGDPESEVPYMGCRTRVIANVYDRGAEKVSGRGNLSFTSINLPRLAIEAKQDLGVFFALLDEKLALVIKQLDKRLALQSSKKVKNFPFLMGQGVWRGSEKLGPEDTIEEVIKHGTLSVGFIGLAETLTALVGAHHAESKESQELGLRIVQHMRDYVDALSVERTMNYTLLATPAEGLSGRFTALDVKKYGVIAGVTDKAYYTNSFHVPVSFKTTIYNKLKLEAPYHAFANAGHISYVELDGDPAKNLDALEKVVRMMKELGIGLGAANHPVDRDRCCGYSGIIDNTCPGCGREADENIDRIRRITGYLVGTVERFNDAKKAEERDRVKHK